MYNITFLGGWTVERADFPLGGLCINYDCLDAERNVQPSSRFGSALRCGDEESGSSRGLFIFLQTTMSIDLFGGFTFQVREKSGNNYVCFFFGWRKLWSASPGVRCIHGHPSGTVICFLLLAILHGRGKFSEKGHNQSYREELDIPLDETTPRGVDQ